MARHADANPHRPREGAERTTIGSEKQIQCRVQVETYGGQKWPGGFQVQTTNTTESLAFLKILAGRFHNRECRKAKLETWRCHARGCEFGGQRKPVKNAIFVDLFFDSKVRNRLGF
jgi:hypothetical protein